MNPVVIGLIVTFGFVALGILGRGIARGLSMPEVYLGMEMALTAVSAAIGFLFELIKAFREVAKAPNNTLEVDRVSGLMNGDIAFFISALVCYFFVVYL